MKIKKKPKVVISISDVKVTRRTPRDAYIGPIEKRDHVTVTGNAEFDAWLVPHIDPDVLADLLTTEVRKSIRQVIDRVRAESANWDQP